MCALETRRFVERSERISGHSLFPMRSPMYLRTSITCVTKRLQMPAWVSFKNGICWYAYWWVTMTQLHGGFDAGNYLWWKTSVTVMQQSQFSLLFSTSCAFVFTWLGDWDLCYQFELSVIMISCFAIFCTNREKVKGVLCSNTYVLDSHFEAISSLLNSTFFKLQL